MRSINNKYLIENEINNEENFCKYIVRECETNKRYIFNILKNDFTYEKTQEYLLNKFKTIKNLNCKSVINLLEFQIVSNMDGIKLDKYQYGYLMEYIDTHINSKKYINSCSTKEKLDIFMELCSVINTLNLKGYIFKNITLKDILLFIGEDENIHVKIDNIRQNEISKVSLINISKKRLPYPYNIENSEESTIWKDNLGEVIQFFEEIFTDEELEMNLKELKDIRKRFNQVRTIKNSYDLNYFIKYINQILNKNYKCFLIESLNTIEDDIDIIGREEELKIVEKNCKKIFDNKLKYKMIAFKGDNGSGKTRLLNEIKYIIENKYFKRVTYINDFITDSPEKTYENISKYIKKLCDKQLYDKYNIYMKKFISICIENYNNRSKAESNQQFQLINRVGKFMREYTSSNPLILVIDDLDKKSRGLREFVRYMSLIGSSLDNMIIIFSLNENECDNNFLQYIKEMKNLDQYEEYKIRLFNQYETTKIIKAILNTNKPIDKLSEKIYSETLGNPQYIKEVIEELFNNNILYFDEEKAEWKTSVDVKDILIPKTLEKRLETSLSSLSEDEIEILRTLSIYENPISEEIVLSSIITDSYDVQIYKELKFKGHIIDKISDQGMLVGFSNNLLRNILYLKLDKERKKEMHRHASELLKKMLSSTNYYMEELLFHLEEGHDYEELCNYSLQYAEILQSHEDYENAILYYKKVLKFSKNNRINATIKIAKMQERLSNHKKSFEEFERAKLYAINEKKLDVQVYIMLEMVIIQINSSINISQEIEEILDDIRNMLNNINSPIGEAYYNYALTLKYRCQINHDKAIYHAKKTIDICKQNNIEEDVYAWNTITLANVYMKISKFDEAKKLCLDAIEIFLKNKNNNGVITCRTLRATINREEGCSSDEVLNEYHEIEKLSIKLRLHKRTICALINMSELYIDEEKYEEAEKSALKALSIEKDEGIDFYSMSIFTILCIVYLNLGRYKLAVKYYSLINQIRKIMVMVEDDVISLNKIDALYNMFICNNLKAYRYLDQSYKINSKNQTYCSRFIMCLYYQLKLYTCESEDEIKKTYNLLLIKIDQLRNIKIESKMKIQAIRVILDIGYYEYAKELFYKLDKYYGNNNIDAMYVYLEFKFKDKSTYNLLINKTLKLCTVISDKKLSADLYELIGEKYEELGCFTLALNNFYESVTLHIDIMRNLPKEDKLVYANNSNFLKVRKQLVSCLQVKLECELKYAVIEKIESIEQLNSVIKEISIKNILSDKKICNLVQTTYERLYYNNWSNIYMVFEAFSSNVVENMDNMLKYMARLTLSDKAILIIENNSGENKVLCTYRISDKEEIDRYFSLKLDSDEDVIMISNNNNRFEQVENGVLKNGIKSCICMKLRNNERRINNEINANGQVILISTNALNYINSRSKKIIEKLKPFMRFLLEKYNLTISSTLDKLTSVYNRKYLQEALIFLVENSQLDNKEFSVIMFDIDDFKGVNDKYGHQTGDEVLVKLTKEVKNTINKNDVIGRYGGEEFVILLSNVTQHEAISMAEKIRKNVEDARILGEKRKVTISMGIAMSNNEKLSSEEIVNRADQALYRAKHEGKNRCVLWKDDYFGSNNNKNTITELSGVVTGSTTRDYNFISMIKEIASIVKNRDNKENKMYEFILKIMQVIECDSVTLFIIDNQNIVQTLSKYRFKDGWNTSEKFNFSIVDDAIKSKKGLYKVDWDNIYKEDNFGVPDWKSVCITPVICSGEVLALIYVSVSVNKKEFGAVDLNQLNLLAEIGTPIFYS